MANIYIIIHPDGYPLVWRIRDVLESVRLYEDGNVALDHMLLAVKLGYGEEFTLLQKRSALDAIQYVDTTIKENIWYHIFSLSHGYDDRYVGRQS